MNKYFPMLTWFRKTPRHPLLSALDYYDYTRRYWHEDHALYREPVQSEIDLLTSIFPPIFPNWKTYVKTFDTIEDPEHGTVIRFEIQYWRSAYESFEDAGHFSGVCGFLKRDGGWFCGHVGGNYIPMSSYGGSRGLGYFWPRDLDLRNPRFSAQYFTSRADMRRDWKTAFSERYAEMYKHLGPKGIRAKSIYQERQDTAKPR